MVIERRFIDWSEPFLPRVAASLLERYRGGDRTTVDLSSAHCVTPGRRSGRILLALLARQCDELEFDLLPPRMLTPGLLADALLPQAEAVAMDVESSFAWVCALKGCTPEEIAPLVPGPPEEDDLISWHALAGTVARLHEELAGGLIEFGDVPEKAECLEMFAEGDRWRALEVVARRYHAELRRIGLVDPHAARRRAIHDAARDGHFESEVILIGVTELNALQRAALERAGGSTVAFVHAPESREKWFDSFGCVSATAWEDATLSVHDEEIIIAEKPFDQAQSAVRVIADLNGAYAADQITIGLGDPAASDVVRRAAGWAGLKVHAATGTELPRTAPVRLLESVAPWLEDARFEEFAALLRGPAVERWLLDRIDDGNASAGGVEDWLSLLDRYFSDHLDERPAGRWLGDPVGRARMKEVWDAVSDLLAPLSGPPQRIGEWCPCVLEVLARVYGGVTADGERREVLEACLKLRDVLSRHAMAARDLQPVVDAATALRIFLLDAAGETIASDIRADQIEMLGWLELHLDPAPLLIVLGCNDGCIPHTISADLFLPDALRRVLGLNDNRHRYARDAYLIEAIRHSRQRVVFIVGRMNADDEPLQPSRLLLACDNETALGRVRRIFKPNGRSRRGLPIGVPRPALRSRFTVPNLPASISPPEHMSVTDFRRYLACPYRYALERLVKLETVGDEALELDAMQFGTLAHAVLEAFGSDPAVREATDPEPIENFLIDVLRDKAGQLYGLKPMPAVRLQLARLEQRFTAFAACQARIRADGWRIDRTEFTFERETALDVPGEAPMPIRGKIDRIDINEATGAWRIIDYKTGDGAKSPHQVHHNSKGVKAEQDLKWCDLQLPLYHYLARKYLAGTATAIELAYVVLPKKADDVEIRTAAWDAAHLDAALELARDVVRRIRAGDFRMNAGFHSPFDTYARICQTLAFGEDDDSDAGTEESA